MDNKNIDLKKLREIAKKKNDIKYTAFNKIVEMCHMRINYLGTYGNTYCWYMVPAFLLGFVNYDLKECSQYVAAKLESEGLHVEYYEPNILFIKWV